MKTNTEIPRHFIILYLLFTGICFIYPQKSFSQGDPRLGSIIIRGKLNVSQISLASPLTITFRPCDSIVIKGDSQLVVPYNTILMSPCESNMSIVRNEPGTFPTNSIFLNVYPNPFYSFEIFEVSSAIATTANLTVFDNLGRVVKNLGSIPLTNLPTKIYWNVTDESNRTIPSGSYLVVVRTKYLTVSRTISLVK